MIDATFHWRKFEAAHWILSQITTSDRTAYSSFWILDGIGDSITGEKDSYYYNYKEYSLKELRKLNKSFSEHELSEAVATLDVNGHTDLYPNNKDVDDSFIKMKDEGRKAYESLYYLALRDQQKNTSIGLQNAENTLVDFVKAEWYRHKNYIITILLLIVGFAGLILQLKCNK